MAVISQNQATYLNNLIAGGGGNAEWAKAQLKGTTVAPAPAPTPVYTPPAPVYTAPKPAPAPVYTPPTPIYTAPKPAPVSNPYINPYTNPYTAPTPAPAPKPVIGPPAPASTPSKAVSQNQYDYLNKLVSGGGGNAEWAKDQLKGVTVTPSTSTPTSTVSNPGLGAGGVNYNDLSSAGKQAMTDSLGKIKNDSAYVNDEVARSLAVIANRHAAGLNTADQENYLYGTLGYKAPTTEPTPPSTGTDVGTPTPAPTPTPTSTISPREETAYDPGTFKNDMTDLINQQTANAYAAQLAKLQELRDTQLLGLKGQEDLSNQNADSQANKASAANAVAAQRLKERMASMGLLDSGYNLENMSDLNAERQSNLGSIEQQRSNNKQAIEEQKTQINNAVAKGDLALLQELQAKQGQQLLDLGYAVDSREFQNVQYEWNKIMQEAGATGNYNGQRTLAGSAQDWGKTVDTANLTGQFNGQSTLAGKQANWNAMKDVWDASGKMVNPQQDWSGLIRQATSGDAPLTQAAQQTKINNLWQSAQQTGFISNDLADAVGLPRGTTTLEAQRLLLQQDQNAQGWAGLDIKQATAANGGSNNTLFTAGQLMNNIQDGLVTKSTVWDANQGQYVTNTTPITDGNTRYNVYKKTILSGNGFTDAQIDAILAAGGFTPAEIKDFQSKLTKEYGISGN
jgi:hypothetical protein